MIIILVLLNLLILVKNIDFSTPEVLHLLGITGWVGRQHVPNTKDEYNDTIIALWRDSQGQKIVKEYVASTSPGKYKNYYNVKGDAHTTWPVCLQEG